MTPAWHRRATGMLAVAVLVAVSPVRGQDAAPAAALVSLAGRYVLDYEQRFTAIVGEERRTQRLVKATGATAKTRTLVSDMLLVKTSNGTQFFRDVIVVDGKPVRDRQERLKKLFLSGSPDPLKQAHAIYRDSVRYDIRFPHLGVPLMLPLLIVKPAMRGRFQFTGTEDGVAFDEVTSPSLIRSRKPFGDFHDMPLRGRLSLDAGTGGLHSASLTSANHRLDTTLEVQYAEDAAVGLLVPVEVRESYRYTGKPKDDHLEIASTYSNFRRFEVTVEESIELPK